MREFELSAPYGAVIYATMTGVKVVFNDDLLQSVSKWLHDAAELFDSTVLPPEEQVTCPQCHGVLQMKSGVPIFCTLCHGRHKVGKSVAATFLSEHASASAVRLERIDRGTGTPPSAA